MRMYGAMFAATLLILCGCSPCGRLEKRKLALEVEMGELVDQVQENAEAVSKIEYGSATRIAMLRGINEAKTTYQERKAELQTVREGLLKCK